MDPTLVVMAAGIGSRFGGTKQLAEVGPDGEAFLDFALTDAADAGVDRTVVVVRSDIEADVRRHVGRRHGHRHVSYVCQDRHGPARAKPWGTAHAVLTAAPEVPGSFVVCNADDYYGRSSFDSIVAAASELEPHRAALCGFRLSATLPEHGSVSRGVCSVVSDRLESIVEHHDIARGGDGMISSGRPAAVLAEDTIVSMNLWAFPRRLLDRLAADFERFVADGGDEDREFQLPTVVADMMADGDLEVTVVPTTESWVGVTNPADLEVARRVIATVRAG